MTSHLPPLLAITNQLIQRIQNVKVFEEHWKLIATRLALLQQRFDEINTLNDRNQLQDDIEQTFSAIGEIVDSCSEKDVYLSGVTYRELESLLLRFQTRLAQYHADLTDNYETKVQILTMAYHEQQTLIQKVFDDKIKERLETIEQQTKETTIEQLSYLRETYFHTIKQYLQRCTELHKSVPLSGINPHTIVEVAQRFYQISSDDQRRLEEKWQTCDLPLTRTFIQFKPDKSTSFERNESRRLLLTDEPNQSHGPHSRKETSKGIWERLVSAPYMMSMTERDRYEQDEDELSEENIIRTKRWIVILGDPGSGKTSFSRWLVRHLAQTLLLNGQHSTDYGPLRIPILIRIGEFAEILKQQPSLSLFDYIGKHLWMGKTLIDDDSSISLDDLSCALQDYVRHGQALIILDGLDEIPASDLRSSIINVVENFVDAYVQTPTGLSAFDNAYLSKLLDDPSRSGGNQIIVTSRIVGYHAAPLAGLFAHYTIRPMDMEHMKDFLHYWFYRVHQQILDTLDLSLPNQGEQHGEALKQELEKKDSVGLLDVASNTCLMSFVCSVAFSQTEGDAPLPTQRISLYEAIVTSMLTLWSSKRSTIPTPDLIHILSDIATYIHGHSASGLIDEHNMKQICIQSIKHSSNKSLMLRENVEAIEDQASEFVQIIREDVGILAARGESLYGFLHLTFQEYFTSLKLINVDHLIEQEQSFASRFSSPERTHLVAQSLHRHANDPRFRIPIALALGKMSVSWPQQDFDHFCLEFMENRGEEEDKLLSLLPLGAYMLISYSNDLVKYPSNDVLFMALDSLMIAAGQHRWSQVCPFLLDQITAALRKLRYELVSVWIETLLSRSPSHDIQTISALCHLLEGKPHEFDNIKWLTQSSCLILQHLSSLDNEENEFAIDRLLVKIAFSHHRLLPISSHTLKEFLITEELELQTIPVTFFPLIISLYGGLKRDGESVVFDPFYIYRESTALTPILRRYFSRSTRHRGDENVMMVKEECLRTLLQRIDKHDDSLDVVDLCIATLCLYDIDQVREKIKLISTTVLRMSLGRLKYISMILRQFYFLNNDNDGLEKKVTKWIDTVIQTSHNDHSSKVQFLALLNSLRSAYARIRSSVSSMLFDGEVAPDKRVILYLPNSLRKEHHFLPHLLSTDIQLSSDRKSSSLLHHFTKLFWTLEHNDDFNTQYQMAVVMDRIPEYLLFRNDEDLLFPLTFVPSHLRNLYLQLMRRRLIIINPKDISTSGEQYLHFSHILVECLMTLSNPSCKGLSIVAALITLLPRLRMNHLENFSSSLLWTLATNQSSYLNDFDIARQLPMNNETGLYINKVERIPGGIDIADGQRRALIKKSIEEEQERLHNALTDKDEGSSNLYSACISLAHVCHWLENDNRLELLEESVQGAMSISNPLIRLDALCVIGFYSHSDYHQIKVNQNRTLPEEIEYQLHKIYLDLPLLLHTAIFIRCCPLLQDQQIINKCLQSLLNKLSTAEVEEQEIISETLMPYICFNPLLSSTSPISQKVMHNKSSVFLEYMNMKLDEHPSSSLILANMYLTELTSDFDEHLTARLHHSYSINESTITSLLEQKSPFLTVGQVSMITNILSSISSSDQSIHVERMGSILINALHSFGMVEFQGRRLLECWMKWKDCDKLCSFASHAALLLTNSDLWSVEAATIVCDLLCCEDDRFRQRAEMILRGKSDDNDIRTSSKLSLEVLLTLNKKKGHFHYTSPFATLTLYRMFDYIIIDNQFHLESFLWLERYRIHTLIDKDYFLNNTRSSSISCIAAYLPNDRTIDVTFCDNLSRISDDLMKLMCDWIKCQFSSFLAIDGDTTSDIVVKSHTQFVVSVLIGWIALTIYNYHTRPLTMQALVKLIEVSSNDEIRQAAVYALGYICDWNTHQILLNQLHLELNKRIDETLNDSTCFLRSLIASYCHCRSLYRNDFNEQQRNLFHQLLNYPSKNVLKAVHTGLGRILKNQSLLFEMLDSDYVQCYQALIGSTAYVFIYDVQQTIQYATAEFIEQHPDLLPIFLVESYNSIRHYTNNVHHIQTTEFYLSYAYPQYIAVAGLVAVRMPAAFCAYIKDWHDGEDFKRALYYTSKQHRRLERAACLTILSVFGELTIELCEMIIEGLRDDPHIQNTCYKCLNRITSIKDQTSVMHLLYSYLKSKSINARYVAVKILLHLSKSSLIPLSQAQTILNELMLDPSANEDLWLIEEQEGVITECVYYYAGSLKDVVYSLIVQHLINDASGISRRNLLNVIDLDFVECEKASRLASCRYDQKVEENTEMDLPSSTKVID